MCIQCSYHSSIKMNSNSLHHTNESRTLTRNGTIYKTIAVKEVRSFLHSSRRNISVKLPGEKFIEMFSILL